MDENIYHFDIEKLDFILNEYEKEFEENNINIKDVKFKLENQDFYSNVTEKDIYFLIDKSLELYEFYNKENNKNIILNEIKINTFGKQSERLEKQLKVEYNDKINTYIKNENNIFYVILDMLIDINYLYKKAINNGTKEDDKIHLVGDELINICKIISEKINYGTKDVNYINLRRKKIYNYLYDSLYDKKLTINQIQNLIHKIVEQYENALIGENIYVGGKAGASIGSFATQSTLNSKHGSATQKQSGIADFNSLFLAQQNKNPEMYITFSNNKSESEIIDFMNKNISITISTLLIDYIVENNNKTYEKYKDIYNEFDLFFNQTKINDKLDYYLVLNISVFNMLLKNIIPSDIINNIISIDKNNINVYYINKDKYTISFNIFISKKLYLSSNPNSINYKFSIKNFLIQNLLEIISNIQISGISNIKDIYPTSVKYSEMIDKTLQIGDNMKVLLKYSYMNNLGITSEMIATRIKKSMGIKNIDFSNKDHLLFNNSYKENGITKFYTQQNILKSIGESNNIKLQTIIEKVDIENGTLIIYFDQKKIKEKLIDIKDIEKKIFNIINKNDNKNLSDNNIKLNDNIISIKNLDVLDIFKNNELININIKSGDNNNLIINQEQNKYLKILYEKLVNELKYEISSINDINIDYNKQKIYIKWEKIGNFNIIEKFTEKNFLFFQNLNFEIQMNIDYDKLIDNIISKYDNITYNDYEINNITINTYILNLIYNIDVIDNSDDFNSKYWYITTSGINIKQFLKLKDINKNTISCNNLYVIYNLFGIEALRSYLIYEMKKSLNKDLLEKHISLLVDVLTQTGKMTSGTKEGNTQRNSNLYSQISYEMNLKNIALSSAMGVTTTKKEQHIIPGNFFSGGLIKIVKDNIINEEEKIEKKDKSLLTKKKIQKYKNLKLTSNQIKDINISFNINE